MTATTTAIDPATIRIAFIGAGNMAASLVGGMLARGFRAERITLADVSTARLEMLAAEHGVGTTTDNVAAAGNADVVVLAVKPQQIADVAVQLGDTVRHDRPLVVSIAAGTPIRRLAGWLGEDAAIVRCMPNTPALVQAGATGLFANAAVSAAQREIAGAMLGAVGLARWLDREEQLDAVTALSGSGPAYFFLVMEAMIDGGRALGLDAALARDLALQTALGAARMALEGDDEPGELRRKVTSPGGTTQAALDVFEARDLRGTILAALTAARDRSRELAG